MRPSKSKVTDVYFICHFHDQLDLDRLGRSACKDPVGLHFHTSRTDNSPFMIYCRSFGHSSYTFMPDLDDLAHVVAMEGLCNLHDLAHVSWVESALQILHSISYR